MTDIDIAAFSPHPDDAELFCSGLLLKCADQGYKTAIVDLTRGELSSNGTIKNREKEARKSSEILNLTKRENLEIDDGNIENNERNRLKVIHIIRELRPKMILMPYWEDRHPDHVNASILIEQAQFYAGLIKIDTGQPAFRPVQCLYYMMHKEFTPSFCVDISDQIARKEKAIACYESQFKAAGNNTASTYINQGHFLNKLKNRARYFGSLVESDYAEPYFCKNTLKIDNIIEQFA